MSTSNQLTTYVGIIRDHSGSMHHLSVAAEKDYNQLLDVLKKQSVAQNNKTVVTVMECGGGYQNVHTQVLVEKLNPIAPYAYHTNGNNTPLWDSIDSLIAQMKTSEYAQDPNAAFVIMATTDGQDNASRKTARAIVNAVESLNRLTERWTLVIRAPADYVSALVRDGVPRGNILEWAQTVKGVEASTATVNDGFSSYYAARSTGVHSTRSFFADATKINDKVVNTTVAAGNLVDISGLPGVALLPVSNIANGAPIREFIETKTGTQMLRGAAFYQLVKSEDKVQDYKIIMVRSKKSGAIYMGEAARGLLGVPTKGDIRLKIKPSDEWEVYVQSTSVNRKVTGGTHVIYYPALGTPFKEGPSSSKKK